MSILADLGVPVFAAEGVPDINPAEMTVTVDGMAGRRVFSLAEIKAMPFSRINARLTSVSGWSVRASWEGVAWADFLAVLKVDENATHATCQCRGIYHHGFV